MTEPKKVNWNSLDVEIQREGRAIKLPKDPSEMPLQDAISALQRKMADEDQVYRVYEVFDAFPFDALVAFVKAMTNLYGWASPATEILNGFFGTTKRPPTMISVKIGHRDEDVVQCPLGSFKLPGVDELINTIIDSDENGRQVFIIHAQVKKKHKDRLLELATETRRILREQSIYRGKAIRLGVDEYGVLSKTTPPEFMDVSKTDDLVFDDDIQEQINHSILTHIVYTKDVCKARIPLKRGVLLEGRYGTGKTLTARMTAMQCEKHGWTFILLDKVQGLKAALEFAKRYSPAVVFAEDIDRIAENRDENANDLINVIDGVVSKNSQVMTILTTNFAEKLDPVILRPGRLDAVISLRPPSDAAVKRLLRNYAGDLLDAEADLSAPAKELSGQIPATIREAVERAKLGMIWRGANKLSDLDLTIAAKTMKNHLALLNRKVETPSAADKLAESLREVVTIGSKDGNGSKALLKTIANNVEDIHNSVV